MEIYTKYGTIKVFALTLEDMAMAQITQFANSPLGENANIRIMPDAHAGKGCVIGTTMLITDKVCPNLVGVDIGCGVTLAQTDIDFASRLKELDEVIRDHVPYGVKKQKFYVEYDFSNMWCWEQLNENVRQMSQYSLGTLGGGNHFIEAYDGGYIAIHSGSRSVGEGVARVYQKLAQDARTDATLDSDLSYLQGYAMEHYLRDMKIVQQFAKDNRAAMLRRIVKHLGGNVVDVIESTHNYIDTERRILRKGAISANVGERMVIPLNMRDGILICEGKGNADWNYSAPHGAGRLYSRTTAKELFTLEEYEEAMTGIFSTCISRGTLDEAPFVYKDWEEIALCIEPTAEIVERLIPIYNFKAS